MPILPRTSLRFLEILQAIARQQRLGLVNLNTNTRSGESVNFHGQARNRLSDKENKMQRNMKVNQIVPLGFGVVFVLMGITTLVSQWGINKLVESTNWVSHTYQVEGELKELEKLLVDAETGQRGYLFTGKEEFLDPYNNASKKIKENMADLKDLTKDNPEQVKRLEEIETLEEQKLDELAQTIALKRADKQKELLALVLSGKGKQIMDEIRVRLEEMAQVEDKLLAERQKTADQTRQLATIVAWGGTLLAIAIGAFISFVIAQIIMRPINEAANAIASSASEIAATTEQQERTAAQQAASVNQTTTTMDELGASSRQAAAQASAAEESARQVLQLAQSSANGAREVLKLAQSSASGARQVLNLAEEGTKNVGQTMEGMSTLKDNVGDLTDQIMRLSEQTTQIGNITSLVTDIANQTNMLALNAAVEAARAGENGKGFAVVASEIRKLADQSKKSAEKINTLIVDIQNAISSTVMVTDESRKNADEAIKLSQMTANALTSVAQAINDVVLASAGGVAQAINDVVLSNQETSLAALNDVAFNSNQLALSSKQQAVAIQQVVDAMNSLNQGASQTASAIRQTKVGTQNLNEAAQNLKVIV